MHGDIYGVVMAVDRFWVVWTTGLAERVSGGKEGFDSLVTQNHQGGHGPQTAGQRLVAAGVADPAHDVLGAKFLQIISGFKQVGLGRKQALAEAPAPARQRRRRAAATE